MYSLNDLMKVRCLLINENKISLIDGYEDIYKKWLDTINSLSSYVDIETSEYEIDLTKIESYPICDKRINLLVIVDLSYPFVTPEIFLDALTVFNQAKPSYLVTHNPRGQIISSLYFTCLSDISEQNSHHCFPYMLSEKESQKIKDKTSLDVYHKYKNKKSYDYSTEKQLKDAIKYKDNLGDYYEKDVSNNQELERSSRDAPERIEKLLSINTGENCLDVGCSSGIITAKLAEKGKKIIGVEIVEELYNEAELLKESLPSSIQDNLFFMNSPIEDCSFDSQQFDTIYMTETLEHIPHFFHDDLFVNLLEYLKKDGNALVSVPNRYLAKSYTQENRHRWDWYNHVTHFTQNSLSHYLSKYFKKLEYFGVYDEPINEGIFLICKASGKK